MTETPMPDPGPVNPTPPPASPAPINFGKTPPGVLFEPAPDQDSRTMGMLAHILGIVTGWLGPLVIWLIKKDQSPFVNDQGKEALNWEITIFIAYLAVGIPLVIISHFIPFAGCFFPIVILVIVVGNIVFAVQGAIAANKGIAYRYPFALRLIK